MEALSKQDVTASSPPPSSGYGGLERSTHFAFQHKIFTLEQAYFSVTRDTREAVYHVPLGDITAALPFATLRAEFGILPDSPDGRLLEIVEKGLRYMKEIRPFDSIPRELLDGSASWSVDDRHLQIAKARLAMKLSTWLSGEEMQINDIAMVQQLAEDPATKQRMQAAVADIAERLGIGSANKQQVMDKIDLFAREMSYIEALREVNGRVKQIYGKLNRLAKVYAKEKSVTEEIVRILQLLRGPLGELEATFGLIDAQTGEIMNILKKYEVQVNFVREMRDDLHFRLREWEDLLSKWESQELVRSTEAEALVKQTYRFVAYNFPQQQSWRR